MRSSLTALQTAAASNGSEADGAASTREPAELVEGEDVGPEVESEDTPFLDLLALHLKDIKESKRETCENLEFMEMLWRMSQATLWAKSFHTAACRLCRLQIPRHRSFVLQDSGCDGRLLDSWDQPEASAAQDLPKHQGWELVERSHSVHDGWLHGMCGMIVGICCAMLCPCYNTIQEHSIHTISHDPTESSGFWTTLLLAAIVLWSF